MYIYAHITMRAIYTYIMIRLLTRHFAKPIFQTFSHLLLFYSFMDYLTWGACDLCFVY